MLRQERQHSPRSAKWPPVIWGILVIVSGAALAGRGTAGSSAAGAHSPHVPSSPPHKTSHNTVRSTVQRQATLFMQRFTERSFDAQWPQLSPAAKSRWPSRSARTSMLARKFPKGMVLSTSVGTPVCGSTWVPAENPGQSLDGAWRVPVAIKVRPGMDLRPSGVAALYRHFDLYLSTRPYGGHASIDGEGPASLDAPIVTPRRRPSISVHVPILMFHRIGPYPSPKQWTNNYGYEIEYGLTVPTSQFDAEMQYLSGHHYHAISLSRLADALLYGLPLPAHPIALTFDDGRQSTWFHAIPALRHYDFTATFFVCSGFVGQTNQTSNHLNVQHYLNWDQVTRLAKSGFWIEDHGQKDINTLWGSSMPALRIEAQRSAQELSAHTHHPIQFIAYTGALWPYPRASQAGSPERSLFARLADLGYAGAAVDARVPSSEESPTQLFQLPRVRVTPGEHLTAFTRSLGTQR